MVLAPQGLARNHNIADRERHRLPPRPSLGQFAFRLGLSRRHAVGIRCGKHPSAGQAADLGPDILPWEYHDCRADIPEPIEPITPRASGLCLRPAACDAPARHAETCPATSLSWNSTDNAYARRLC